MERTALQLAGLLGFSTVAIAGGCAVLAACDPAVSTPGPEPRAAAPAVASTSAPAPISAPASAPASAPSPAPAPPAAPPAFWARYSRRLAPGSWATAETASLRCSSMCVALLDDELHSLREAFAKHRFRSMTTHEVAAGPHRGGVCLAAGWGPETKEICDVTTTAVDALWEAEWTRLCEEVLAVFLRAQARAANGTPGP